MYRGVPLPVLDLLDVIEPAAKGREIARASTQIVVMAPSNAARFGLMVDDLGEIAEVLTERLTPLPAIVAHQHMFADAALAANSEDDGDLIVMLRADRLYDNLARAAEPSAISSRTGNPPASKRLAGAGGA
jgi:chemotaxis signal transduction protein